MYCPFDSRIYFNDTKQNRRNIINRRLAATELITTQTLPAKDCHAVIAATLPDVVLAQDLTQLLAIDPACIAAMSMLCIVYAFPHSLL
jgi:hypothetical protein